MGLEDALARRPSIPAYWTRAGSEAALVTDRMINRFAHPLRSSSDGIRRLRGSRGNLVHTWPPQFALDAPSGYQRLTRAITIQLLRPLVLSILTLGCFLLLRLLHSCAYSGTTNVRPLELLGQREDFAWEVAGGRVLRTSSTPTSSDAAHVSSRAVRRMRRPTLLEPSIMASSVDRRWRPASSRSIAYVLPRRLSGHTTSAGGAESELQTIFFFSQSWAHPFREPGVPPYQGKQQLRPPDVIVQHRHVGI